MISESKKITTAGLPLAKLTGAGNDFLVIDWRDGEVRRRFKKIFRSATRANAARRLCRSHFSIGADGLLFLENSKIANVKWDFYNADGSRAEMCGNAARVVGLYEQMHSPRSEISTALTLETRAGVVTVSNEGKTGGNFRVEMPAISEFELGLAAPRAKDDRFRKLQFDYVNSGVPHAVVYVPRAKNIRSLENTVDNLVDVVDNIRALPKFKKHGTNVTFYATSDGRGPAKSKSANIASLTFERGVLGYTLACGTGAVAAAYSFSTKRSQSTSFVRVRVPGGHLQVDFKTARPQLIGPAQFIARSLYYEP